MFFPAPFTVHLFPGVPSLPGLRLISLPISGTAAAVERQSALGRGLLIVEVPSARVARIRARIVCDFEPGTVIEPERLCLDALIIIFNPFT